MRLIFITSLIESMETERNVENFPLHHKQRLLLHATAKLRKKVTLSRCDKHHLYSNNSFNVLIEQTLVTTFHVLSCN